MIYYIIRHKLTKEIMPQMKRGRGYSHWNPSNKGNPSYKVYSVLKTPRIFSSIVDAQRAIKGWFNYPNGKYSPMYDTESGYTEMDLHFKDDGRLTSNLEIVKVSLREIKSKQKEICY